MSAHFRAKAALVLAAIVALAVLPAFSSSPYLLHIIILTFVYTIGAISFRTILLSGQFPLAHAAFMGIGAYTAALLSRNAGWPPYLTIPAGAIAAGVIGLLFGYPFARLRTLYYAMGSLFFGVAITYIVQSLTVTGGYVGLTGIQPLFATTSRVPPYYFFLVLTIFCAVVLFRFEFSRIGVTLKAVAQSHTLASSVGVNEVRYRVLAVTVGCFFVGLAGASFAHYNGLVTPSTYNLAATLWLTMYVMIGGMGSFAGPIIGTPILYFIPQYYFSELKSYSPFVPALILILVAYFMPKGLMGLLQSAADRLYRRGTGAPPEGRTADAA